MTLRTVVGSAEDSNELSLCEELVSIFNDLMRTANEVEIVLLEEFFYNVCTEGERNASIVLAPTGDALLGIRPQQIAQKASIGHVRRPNDLANLLHIMQFGAQATVHAKDLFVYYCCDGHAVEALGEGLPQLNVISSFAYLWSNSFHKKEK